MNKELYDQKVWSEILSKGETIAFDFSIGRKNIKYRAILFGVFGGFVFLIPAIALLFGGSAFLGLALLALFALMIWHPLFYLPRANMYALTNKRVLVRRGWLSATTQSIDYISITDVAVNQGILSKTILNTGTLLVNTAGHLTNQVVLRDIESPYEIKKKIDELKERQLTHEQK